MTMMKTTAALLAVATAATGFTAPAFAQGRDNDRWERREDRREARHERREDRRDNRHDRRDERRDDRRWDRGHVHTAPSARYTYNHNAYPRYYAAPRYSYNYGYAQPRARYWVGGYVPTSYRQPYYYVNDWHSYNGLYAPPYGYQWVRTDTGDFLLMALATGLIANLILSSR